ncbi:DUF547 domain-containing protein [Frigoriflavimonas asaccharolytica]|uniref:DUF547 domain-containing protein n=1 Tax=Frigoriflavimonas asaccharolytica TaxID=2735899 RepID=A0A8J8GAE2_9FLAO|nr:DUF547 domain-containing protein [Frigoriflavimonas asaccharolytica]NRS92937.1 hypothetical protein [Frigoriflavimonas asaccharolytica]
MSNNKTLITVSGNLLLNVKMSSETKIEEGILANYSISSLQNELKTEAAKNTFWINIYNAYFQIVSRQEENLGKKIFTLKLIEIAGNRFSLDDIEHGILRRFRWKYSFGYLSNIFQSRFIKNLAVEKIDYRIHFAVNCGAKSCPPIAFYTVEKLDEQLKTAMISFLTSESTIDKEKKTVTTSKLLLWYQGDFGGKSDLKKMLKEVLEIQMKYFKIKYSDYSWESHLENFS